MEVLVEWLLEILGSILGALLEVFAEALLQIAMEALAEVGIHLARGKVEHPESRSKWRLIVGYPILGAIAGGLSLLVFPHSLAHGHNGRLATLLLVPVFAAATTVALGRWRARRGQEPVNIDRMAYAYLFALGMAAVRYIGAS
jgi:uncharacterized membrane protein